MCYLKINKLKFRSYNTSLLLLLISSVYLSSYYLYSNHFYLYTNCTTVGIILISYRKIIFNFLKLFCAY